MTITVSLDGYQQSIALGLTGTDFEQVEVLKTLTGLDIPTSEVRVWLRENNLWFKVDPVTMGGSLQDSKRVASTAVAAGTNTSADEAVIVAMATLYAPVFGESARALRTSDKVWSAQVNAVVNLLAEVSSQETENLIDSFYDLGGGRPYKDLTEAEFDTQRTRADGLRQLQEAQTELQNRVLNAVALAGERLLPSMNADTQAATWAQAWEDAV